MKNKIDYFSLRCNAIVTERLIKAIGSHMIAEAMAENVNIEAAHIENGTLKLAYSNDTYVDIGHVVGQDGEVGQQGPKGDKGNQGEPGLTPKHRWEGTKLQFQNPDGTWGPLRELQGRPGRTVGAGVSDSTNVLLLSEDYTSRGSQKLVAVEAITLTLNYRPGDGETVTIKRTNGDVVINGNGRLIDDAGIQTIYIEYTSLTLVYAKPVDKWLVI